MFSIDRLQFVLSAWTTILPSFVSLFCNVDDGVGSTSRPQPTKEAKSADVNTFPETSTYFFFFCWMGRFFWSGPSRFLRQCHCIVRLPLERVSQTGDHRWTTDSAAATNKRLKCDPAGTSFIMSFPPTTVWAYRSMATCSVTRSFDYMRLCSSSDANQNNRRIPFREQIGGKKQQKNKRIKDGKCTKVTGCVRSVNGVVNGLRRFLLLLLRNGVHARDSRQQLFLLPVSIFISITVCAPLNATTV